MFDEVAAFLLDQQVPEAEASRFFYCPKASSKERHAGLGGKKNNHPCLKPIALTEYLAKLILPPARENEFRRLLVPYSGTGSEMIGAIRAGWEIVEGIEKEGSYIDIAEARIHHFFDERIKQRLTEWEEAGGCSCGSHNS